MGCAGSAAKQCELFVGDVEVGVNVLDVVVIVERFGEVQRDLRIATRDLLAVFQRVPAIDDPFYAIDPFSSASRTMLSDSAGVTMLHSSPSAV